MEFGDSWRSGGTMTGSLSILGDLTVSGDFNFGDVSTDVFTINGYIQGSATGKKFVSIGDATSAHSLTDIDDFVVTGKSEFQDVVYFDGDINTNGTFQMGSSTADTGAITMIKGAQTGDPQVTMALTADANGDFSITTDTGDITLASASDVYFKTGGTLRVAIGTSLITIPTELKTNNATIPMLLTSRVSDGASAVAFTMDSDNALSTAGAKIVSFTNNNAEKAYIDYTGLGYFDGGITIGGKTIYTPSSDNAIAAATGITTAMLANKIIRVAGDGGAINITADPQIADGTDGQVIILQGTHDTNTVQFDTGTGLSLDGGTSMVLGNNDILALMYDSGEDLWIELYRSNNS